MIRTEDVIEFFDSKADGWDSGLIRHEAEIGKILDNAYIKEGVSVLDVATGTGVLIPDYLNRKASSITAIDISPEMVKIAKDKFAKKGVKVICGDACSYDFACFYDRIVVFNAFPHFADPFKLIRKLSSILKPGGYLTVAHDLSKKALDDHHHSVAESVSSHLMEADDLASLFDTFLTVTTVISADSMYQVVGQK